MIGNSSTPTSITDVTYRKAYTYTTLGNGMTVVEYIGITAAHIAKTSKGWVIKKLIYDASGNITDELFANGSDDGDKVWNDYLTYTYTNT